MQAEATLLVPRDRVGAIIGKNGLVKTEVERKLGVEIRIASDTGLVEMRAGKNLADPSALLRAKDIVSAIARGFSPEKALALMEESVILDIIDLRDVFGKSTSDITRIKGRIIGQEGKIRRLIEEMTGSKISVFGHTVAIIGDYESAISAREAVEILIKGRQHSTLYRFLQRIKRESKRRKTLELWENQQARKPKLE